MNLEQIKAEAHEFFEWPGDDKTSVLTTSAMLFARHCADKAVKELVDDLLSYVQHDSWRCGYRGECHCGLNAITERFGLPAIPLPEKGESK